MTLPTTRASRQSALAIAVAAALASGNLFAGGFSLIEHGVSGLGNAYAGAGAVSVDGSTLWFNAAGITELENREVSLAAHLLLTDTTFTNEGTTLATELGGDPVSGPDTADPGTAAVLPNFYYTAPINDRWNYGLGIGVPFGSATEYDEDWVGRYTTIDSGITVIDINPNIAFRLTDAVRLGGGISVQFLDADLTSAIDSGAVCLAVLGSEAVGQADACLDDAGLAPGDVTRDGLGSIEGTSVGIGFNLGVLFVPSKSTKIGLAFRSGVDHELDGTGEFETDDQLRDLLDGVGSTLLTNTDASADVTLPATISLSAAQWVSSRIQLLADVTWTNWSVLDELRIEFENEQQPDTVNLLSFNDALRVSGGINFDLTDRIRLRGGLAWDEEAIPGPAERTARIPGNDRTWFSVGLGYKVSDRFSFDLGYTHISIEETAINNTNLETAGGSIVRGTFDSSVDILAAQINWTFN